MIWDKFSIFRTNRAIPRGARAYCREDFREDVARRNINKMASKITSAISIPNLRQGLLEHFLIFECSHESEDDSSFSDICRSIFFAQIQSRRLVKHVVQGITQWSRQFTKRFTAQRYGQPNNTEGQQKKQKPYFLPKYDCIRHFDLSFMLCCKLHVTFISYKITYILHNENIFI